MVIIDGDPTTLQGGQGETITVSVTESGTVRQVAHALNGVSFTGGSFVLTAPPNPYRLITTVGYSQQDGGSYVIKLTGSNGGTSTVTLTQAPGQADDSVGHSIDIV
jgi:hypothetical protein